MTRACRTEESERGMCGLVAASRWLMGLMALLMVIAPWTEHYRLFDNFPRGQDFELSVLAFLGFLCLVLLMALLRKQRLDHPPAATGDSWKFRAGGKQDRTLDAMLAWVARTSHSPPCPSSRLGAFSLPLQI